MTPPYHQHVLISGTVLLFAILVVTGGDPRRSLAALIFGLLFLLILSHFVKLRIVEPLRETSAAVHRMAQGTGEALPVQRGGGVPRLLADINALSRNLAQREKDLVEGRRRAESVLLAIGEGILVLDRTGRVTITNRAMRQLLATDRDLVGQTTLDLFRNPNLEGAVRLALEGGHPEPVEVDLPSGFYVRVQAAGVPNLLQQVDSAVVVFHDRTETRKTEAMRRDFIANVSHEFKTPLTVIRGYTETLLSGGVGEDAATEFLRIVERNARHLESLVGSLLTLGRLEAELPASMESINVRALIEDQITLRRAVIDRKQIRVINDCAADVVICADGGRLGTALSNLLDNAIAYNRPSGEIRIASAVENGELTLSISDTGDGIPPAELQRIFERFYRVDRARTRDSGGTGLGLAIVKHAIESQGGTITVASKVGTGSTFTIHLPMNSRAA